MRTGVPQDGRVILRRAAIPKWASKWEGCLEVVGCSSGQ